MKPKNAAPRGKRMLAVLIGLGHRRILLRPLTNMRQPRTTRRAASANTINVECSKALFLSSFCAINVAHYTSATHMVKYGAEGTIIGAACESGKRGAWLAYGCFNEICLLKDAILIVSAKKLL